MTARERDDDLWAAAALRRERLRAIGLTEKDWSEEEDSGGKEGYGAEEQPVNFGWMDVVAFTVAAYQVLFPFLAAMIGVGVLIYLLLWFWAR